jgi:hypothetical protein
MLNTHYYDGKIEQSLTFNNYTLTEKKEKYNELLTKITNPISLHFFNILQKDINTDHNIDPTNNINADDLICLCWEHKDNNVFVEELEIQLADMINGNCAQGRTHRLYQLLLAFN